MKFPSSDVIAMCVNMNCADSKEGFFLEEARARIRKEGDEIVAEAICPTCAKDAMSRGIPAPLISSLVKREEESRATSAANTAELARYDIRQAEIAELFSVALYACVVPGCGSAPEPATKMFSVVSVEGGTEKSVPICPACAEQARKMGVKVSDLHGTIARLARETRNTLLYEQEQNRLAPVKKFLDQCQKVGTQQGAAVTAPVHRDNGFRGGARLAPASK